MSRVRAGGRDAAGTPAREPAGSSGPQRSDCAGAPHSLARHPVAQCALPLRRPEMVLRGAKANCPRVVGCSAASARNQRRHAPANPQGVPAARSPARGALSRARARASAPSVGLAPSAIAPRPQRRGREARAEGPWHLLVARSACQPAGQRRGVQHQAGCSLRDGGQRARARCAGRTDTAAALTLTSSTRQPQASHLHLEWDTHASSHCRLALRTFPRRPPFLAPPPRRAPAPIPRTQAAPPGQRPGGSSSNNNSSRRSRSRSRRCRRCCTRC